MAMLCGAVKRFCVIFNFAALSVEITAPIGSSANYLCLRPDLCQRVRIWPSAAMLIDNGLNFFNCAGDRCVIHVLTRIRSNYWVFQEKQAIFGSNQVTAASVIPSFLAS